jgi:hypothetical protein
MERVDDCSFEDFSVSSTLERAAFALEQAIDKWIVTIAHKADVPGQSCDECANLHTALEGLSSCPVCEICETHLCRS